ncbi:MAG: hemerythrin family protein [Thermodesulfovibrionales bacterium]
MFIEELIRYAQFYFISEENMLYKINFVEYKRQKKMHMELIDRLTQRINTPEDSTQNPVELINFLVKWFIEHTVEEDIKSFQNYVNP